MIRLDVASRTGARAESLARGHSPARTALLCDAETGLTWTLATCPGRLDWYDALAWVAENNTDARFGFTDWRLPNAAELAHVKRRFPGIFPDSGARIITLLPEAMAAEPAQTPLQTSPTHGPRLQNAAGKPAGDRVEHLWSPVQGGRAPRTPTAADPGHVNTPRPHSPIGRRIFDRVPLVRTTGALDPA
ncbi:DUF1566 domain-containing protein [Tropicimonas sediminicola]|uniref:Lcl C-terminal domain-containing protein n=1 Tax=Tropicimonas sediminicola TaxID=1031541 RepID=A0A239F2U1_9RHOB|nr:DUF1566 domain-containing protein [Tropicimonas sediminicola]SNS51137.1 Protein of unknown function [Tropicimonas sediminicola]